MSYVGDIFTPIYRTQATSEHPLSCLSDASSFPLEALGALMYHTTYPFIQTTLLVNVYVMCCCSRSPVWIALEACSTRLSSRVWDRSHSIAKRTRIALKLGEKVYSHAVPVISLLFCLCSDSPILILIPPTFFSSSLKTLSSMRGLNSWKKNYESYLSLVKTTFLE